MTAIKSPPIDPGTVYVALQSFVSAQGSVRTGDRIRGSSEIVKRNPLQFAPDGLADDEVAALWNERFPGIPRPPR